MAVYTREAVQANLRVRNGKRVFYLDARDHLTPEARQWLNLENVEILPASAAKPAYFTDSTGTVLREKPEHMTHLREQLLVPKIHPRIRFRGMLDSLQAEILLCARTASAEKHIRLAVELEEVLDFTRRIMRCDVLEQTLDMDRLCGLTPSQLREQSHQPQRHFGIPHFMPAVGDSRTMLQLNKLRTLIRQTELAACEAFRGTDGEPERPDLLQAMNRLSSLIWIMMIRLKKEEGDHGA